MWNNLITEDDDRYYEPAAFQLDPSILRSVLYDAIDENGVELLEKTEVQTIVTKGNEIQTCITSNGKFDAKTLLMQRGPGVPSCFQKLV